MPAGFARSEAEELTKPVVPEIPATDAEWLKRPGLSAALIAIALIELLWALADLPNLFGGVSNLFGDVPRSALAVPITTARLVCHPLLAIAALVLAATGRLRHAIVALGGIVIMTWLNHLPWLGRLNLEETRDLQWAVKQIVAFPLMTVVAVLLAARDTRLGLAIALVSIPTVNNLLGLASYVVGIVINGP
jgi:hypothetical protein